MVATHTRKSSLDLTPIVLCFFYYSYCGPRTAVAGSQAIASAAFNGGNISKEIRPLACCRRVHAYSVLCSCFSILFFFLKWGGRHQLVAVLWNLICRTIDGLFIRTRTSATGIAFRWCSWSPRTSSGTSSPTRRPAGERSVAQSYRTACMPFRLREVGWSTARIVPVSAIFIDVG